MSNRVYSLCEGHREDRTVVRWGVSRYDREHDAEMEAAVCSGQQFGKQSIYIEWTPKPLKQHSPERMLAQRIQNMRRRIESKFPLFADQFEREEMKRDKFSLETCQADYERRGQVDGKWHAEWWAAHPEDRRVCLPDAKEKTI